MVGLVSTRDAAGKRYHRWVALQWHDSIHLQIQKKIHNPIMNRISGISIMFFLSLHWRLTYKRGNTNSASTKFESQLLQYRHWFATQPTPWPPGEIPPFDHWKPFACRFYSTNSSDRIGSPCSNQRVDWEVLYNKTLDCLSLSPPHTTTRDKEKSLATVEKRS